MKVWGTPPSRRWIATGCALAIVVSAIFLGAVDASQGGTVVAVAAEAISP